MSKEKLLHLKKVKNLEYQIINAQYQIEENKEQNQVLQESIERMESELKELKEGK